MSTRREFVKRAASIAVAAAVASKAASKEAGTVQTVSGPLEVSRLGFTLTHEHIADAPDVLKRWPGAWGGRSGLIDKAVERLAAAKAAGISTVVDLTTHDVGRDIRFLEEVSRKSGLNIIASTGQRFFAPESPLPPAGAVAELTEYFVKEIDQGIDDSGIKAGVIKIGVNGGRPTSREEMGLRAAARASKATGVPIRVHTHAAERGGENVAVVLEDEGAEPGRVCFDHSDDSGHLDYLLGLARRGYYLSMDHVHRGLLTEFEPSFEKRVECIKALVDAGFADRLFLSSDSEFGGSLLPREQREWRENIDPAEGMLFVVQRLLPRLRDAGVTAAQIQRMTVGNPGAFLGRRS